MSKETITTASILLSMWDTFQEAVWDMDEAKALAVVHSMVKNRTRIDSATYGFAAGLYFGKHQERERRRMAASIHCNSAKGKRTYKGVYTFE